MANFYDDDKLNEKETSVENNESLSLNEDANNAVVTSQEQSEQKDEAAETSLETAPQQLETEQSEASVSEEASDDKKEESEVESDNVQEDKPAKKAKSGKSLSKKTKIIVTVTVVATVLVLLLGVVLPIVLYHAPRIFVKSAEDFVAGDKTGQVGKYFYSLDKNISCDTLTLENGNVYSIDMNKHSITVANDFNIVCNEDRKGTMYIGTRKDDTVYNNKKATLTAKTININAPNLDVVIAADIVCETLNVTAKSISVANSKNGSFSKLDITINALSAKFTGNVSASAGSSINISGCPSVIVNKGVNIGNTINLTQSSSIASGANSTISTLNLDNTCTASIAGNVTNLINGGKQVVMESGHSCNTYQNIDTLVIFRDVDNSNIIKNCKNVIYVEKLATPSDINIEELNGKIYCVVAKVAFASGYNYYVNDELVATSKETKVDITDHVKEAGKYKIKVVPVGNYVAGEDLTGKTSGTMYVDGDAISTNYNCVFTLQAPQGLKVTQKDDKYILSFNQVLHAETYKIIIDGKTIKRADASALSEDITQYIGIVGDHSIRVQALNSNENIHNSEESMISYYHTEALEAVTELIGSFNDDHTSINVQWQGVTNGYEYEVSLQVGDGSAIKVGRTSILKEDGTVVFAINLQELGLTYDSSSSYKVTVKAVGHNYYTDSVAANNIVGAPAAE